MAESEYPKGFSQVLVQIEDFDLEEQYTLLRDKSPNAGAIVTFSGLVRELYSKPKHKTANHQLQDLFLEHYPVMTEKVLYKLIHQARQRWPIQAVNIIHRVGQLTPRDQIVLVGVSSAHRRDAFEAAEFLMDYLKTKAPFWKKETLLDNQSNKNTERWVETKESDAQATERWK